mmetsp:Transcript_5120/g.15315  ORF Transcript_5120/g.15315 Transcript_5120/m.15315 type:complete len:235 (-) Transcript_5120:736-1440(-)
MYSPWCCCSQKLRVVKFMSAKAVSYEGIAPVNDMLATIRLDDGLPRVFNLRSEDLLPPMCLHLSAEFSWQRSLPIGIVGFFSAYATHGCLSASSADILLRGSTCSIDRIKDFAPPETVFHSASGNLYSPFVVLSMMASSDLPKKGILPERTIYINTPQAHISTAQPCFCFRMTSGAIYPGVPPWFESLKAHTLSLSMNSEMPKSAMTMLRGNVLLQQRMFSGFRSLCAMPMRCR